MGRMSHVVCYRIGNPATCGYLERDWVVYKRGWSGPIDKGLCMAASHTYAARAQGDARRAAVLSRTFTDCTHCASLMTYISDPDARVFCVCLPLR